MNLPSKCIEQIEKLSENHENLSFREVYKLGAYEALTTPSIYESAGLVKKDSQQSQQGKTPRFASWIIDLLAQKGWKGFEDVDEIKEVVDRAIAEREESQQDKLDELEEWANGTICTDMVFKARLYNKIQELKNK